MPSCGSRSFLPSHPPELKARNGASACPPRRLRCWLCCAAARSGCAPDGTCSKTGLACGADGDGFRCRGCYHLFGVDLIADSSRRMHVIEVNVAPDLSLSTQGAACDGEHASKNCTDGSTAYDHTKLAAAYNTVRLVYSRQAVAQRLERIGDIAVSIAGNTIYLLEGVVVRHGEE